MCGRYYVDDETAREIERLVRNLDRRFQMKAGDVCPARQAAVICADAEDRNLCLKQMYWGFPGPGQTQLVINARAESALEKKTFRDSVLCRRCIIPAKGFYEWNRKKEKYQFERKGGGLMFMAGFYNLYQAQEHFVILTTQANPSVRNVHDRMPLILEETEIESWLTERMETEGYLRRTPPLLDRRTDYEQITLF